MEPAQAACCNEGGDAIMKPAPFGVATCLALGLSSVCMADDLRADRKFSGTIVGFVLRDSYSNFTLTVSGPNEFHTSAFSRTEAPSIDLGRSPITRMPIPLEDGTYTYQLTAATDEKVRIRTPLDNGRAERTTEHLRGVSTSGTFNVQRGVIVPLGPAARRDADAR
jgi:hypothetical protein